MADITLCNLHCWCFFSMYTCTAKTLTRNRKITLLQYGAKPNIKHALSLYINFIVSMVALICMCGGCLSIAIALVSSGLAPEHQHHHTHTYINWMDIIAMFIHYENFIVNMYSIYKEFKLFATCIYSDKGNLVIHLLTCYNCEYCNSLKWLIYIDWSVALARTLNSTSDILVTDGCLLQWIIIDTYRHACIMSIIH